MPKDRRRGVKTRSGGEPLASLADACLPPAVQ